MECACCCVSALCHSASLETEAEDQPGARRGRGQRARERTVYRWCWCRCSSQYTGATSHYPDKRAICPFPIPTWLFKKKKKPGISKHNPPWKSTSILISILIYNVAQSNFTISITVTMNITTIGSWALSLCWWCWLAEHAKCKPRTANPRLLRSTVVLVGLWTPGCSTCDLHYSLSLFAQPNPNPPRRWWIQTKVPRQE